MRSPYLDLRPKIRICGLDGVREQFNRKSFSVKVGETIQI